MSAVYKRIQILIRKITKQHRENFELHVRTFFLERFWFLSGREPFTFVSHSHSEAWIAEYRPVLPITNEFPIPLCQHKSSFLKDFIQESKSTDCFFVFVFIFCCCCCCCCYCCFVLAFAFRVVICRLNLSEEIFNFGGETTLQCCDFWFVTL